MPVKPNRLLLGDNLCLLEALPAASVNLVYLDPPFFTQQTWTGRAGSFEDKFAGLDAYLAFMRPRLVDLHRVLTPSGSLYLHCDYHADAYLFLLLVEIFGARQYRNQIIWKRMNGMHNDAKTFGHMHDKILFFAKSARNVWNKPLHVDATPLTDCWLDIKPLTSGSKESTGYPTQKPLALLERIIAASSHTDHVASRSVLRFRDNGSCSAAARQAVDRTRRQPAGDCGLGDTFKAAGRADGGQGFCGRVSEALIVAPSNRHVYASFGAFNVS